MNSIISTDDHDSIMSVDDLVERIHSIYALSNIKYHINEYLNNISDEIFKIDFKTISFLYKNNNCFDDLYAEIINKKNHKVYCIIGMLYFYDFVFENHNKKKAFELFQKANELGNSSAMVYLGSMYYHGEYVKKDIKKAFELFQKASDFGNIDAIEDIIKFDHNIYGSEILKISITNKILNDAQLKILNSMVSNLNSEKNIRICENKLSEIYVTHNKIQILHPIENLDINWAHIIAIRIKLYKLLNYNSVYIPRDIIELITEYYV